MGKVWDLKLVVLVIGGVQVSGYGNGDDAIGFEWVSPLAESDVMADGDVVYSRLNDRRLKATLTLSQKSRAHLLLWGLIEAQHGDNIGVPVPLLLPLPFMMLDFCTGESIGGECVFMSRPAGNKGKKIGNVEYMIELPNPKIGPAILNII